MAIFNAQLQKETKLLLVITLNLFLRVCICYKTTDVKRFY